jgi:hypothetical protein
VDESRLCKLGRNWLGRVEVEVLIGVSWGLTNGNGCEGVETWDLVHSCVVLESLDSYDGIIVCASVHVAAGVTVC